MTTLRTGGVSAGPYASLNLAQHVGDDPTRVAENRRRLARVLALPAEPLWLTQVHGCDIADVQSDTVGCTADAAFADRPDSVCAVLTADCLPVLITNRAGSRVAAVHAGWRGLVGGVIEAALSRFSDPPSDLLAWLGPAIGPQAFEVGAEVQEAFVALDSGADGCFSPNRPGHWLADIYALARRRLAAAGIGFVGGGEYCTVTDATRFYSYRRDGVTGRMASLIWIDSREAS
jgi:YfiH family protein